LTAEGSREISGATLLQKNDTNEKHADEDVDNNDEIEEDLHC
jgi:hypothetical protein